jgi:7-cyano-7-deazaguanine synthase
VKSAVVLVSGGLDSATVLAMAVAEGWSCNALSVDYGQRHRAELAAAVQVARALGAAEHRTAHIDLGVFGGSALTDRRIPVPTASAPGIPVTYVPARNTIFLAYALALAEVRGAADLFIGVNAVDYSGYPDCRPEYVAAFEAMANLATRAAVEGRGLRIHAPLQQLTKAGIITMGVALGVDYGLTLSCYDPGPGHAACGACDSCQLRRKGFAEAGVPDPTRYA